MRIQVDGVGTVEVGDDFKAMSPEDQDAFVSHIAEQAGKGIKSALPTSGSPSTASDVAKSAGTGLAKGAIGVVGTPGSLSRGIDYAIARGLGWAAEKVGAIPPGASERFARDAAALNLPRDPVSLPTPDEIQGAIEKDVTGKFYTPKTTAGKYAETAASFAPMAAMLPGNTAANVVRQGLIPGVASEAAGQAAAGSGYETAARVAGGLAGASLNPLRAVTPLPAHPSRLPLINTLDAEGVPMTAGQRTGSKPLQWIESTLGDIPGAGGKVHDIQAAQREAFTAAALKRAGMNDRLATPEAMLAGRDRLGATFDDLAARNTLRMDKQFAQELGDTLDDYMGKVSVSNRAPGVTTQANDLYNTLAGGGTMPGPAYADLRTRLRVKADGVAASDPSQAEAYRGMKRSIDGAMGRSISPDDAANWAQANREYANYKSLEKAAGRAGENAAEGYISPAQLRTAIASGQKHGAYVRGQGDLADLARAGVGLLSPLPNSGTAPRHYAQGLMSIPGAMLGSMAGGAEGAAIGTMAGAAVPAVAGRLLMADPVQAYLGNQVATGLLANPNLAPPTGIGLLSVIENARRNRQASQDTR